MAFVGGRGDFKRVFVDGKVTLTPSISICGLSVSPTYTFISAGVDLTDVCVYNTTQASPS